MKPDLDMIAREAAARCDDEIMTAGRTMCAAEFRALLEQHIRQALEAAMIKPPVH